MKFFLNLTVGPVLSLICFLTPIVQAAETASPYKVRTSCSLTSNENERAFLEFETKKISDFGHIGETLPKNYSIDTYPFKDYQSLQAKGEKFRIALQLMANPYTPGKYVAYASIYQEMDSQLVRRFAQSVAGESLNEPLQFSYSSIKTKTNLTCYSAISSSTGNNNKKKTSNRIPARAKN
jgi:hypothetical protein